MMKMNEFMEKKLGEVLAFSLVGQDTINKGKDALSTIIEPEKLETYRKRLVDIAAEIGEVATEITRAKCEKTSTKLKKLRDIYVGDEWDNPTEVLEWAGFFEGAAIVHWFLILGAAQELDNLKLAKLAHRGVDLHRKSLKNVEDKLQETGAKRAKS